MLGRPGESGSGKASNNGVRSCKFDLLNEVAAKLGGEGEIKFVHLYYLYNGELVVHCGY